MSFKYILESVKEKFNATEKYEKEGFNLNYEVGNTSGLDIAPGVPSAVDERIGSLAQRGGSVMEVMVQNPSTFQIDRDRMFDVINQLEIDISIHSDPNVAFTSAYRSQSAGGVGYDPAHSYFTQYLKQFAVFKKKLEKRTENDERFNGFEISRINPHISTSALPALEESRPADTGLDPFGFNIAEITEDSFDQRDDEGQNIYRNKEFLKRLYQVFLKEEVDYEYQYYGLLADFSRKFEKEWVDARKEETDSYFRDVDLEDKVAIVRTASAQDPGIEAKWPEILRNQEFEDIDISNSDMPQEILNRLPGKVENLEDANRVLSTVTEGSVNFSNIRMLPTAQYNLEKNFEVELVQGIDSDETLEKIKNVALEALEKALVTLWDEKEDNEDRYYVSIDRRVQAISNRLEIPPRRIQKNAFLNNQEDLEKAAEGVITNKSEYFEDSEEPEDDYMRFLRAIAQNFQSQMWSESNILYKIIPAWMSVSNKSTDDGYRGWKAPEYIWETLVKQKWEGERGEEIDLKNPRNSGEGEGFLDLLENNQEFQMDVAAASAACYVWGHFTQKKGQFRIDEDILREVFDVDADKIENRDMTWIEWMKEFGIGVNLESMPGSPQQMYKIWRPKDIVAASRAINITAREELKDGDDFFPELDGRPAKFTIDLEHTATFGVDPWKTMENLIEQEKKLAETGLSDKYNLEIDQDKPLAKVLRMWHLMRAGMETSQAETLHGPWDPGDMQLYTYLYKMVEAGFARNDAEKAYVMYEVGGDDRGTVYIARIAMNLIELGVEPDELDPAKVDPGSEYRDEKEALMARFFGMDRPSFDREWTKIEEHAFDPLQGLLEAEQWDYTYSSQAAIQNDNRPQEWMSEEYK